MRSKRVVEARRDGLGLPYVAGSKSSPTGLRAAICGSSGERDVVAGAAAEDESAAQDRRRPVQVGPVDRNDAERRTGQVEALR